MYERRNEEVLDIMVNEDRDLILTDDGDIVIGEETSLSQLIKTRLLWIEGEWRLGPELGFPWFEDVLVKNPNTDIIMSDIREAIMEIEGTDECDVELVSFDRQTREIVFRYEVVVDGEIFTEEVTFNA